MGDKMAVELDNLKLARKLQDFMNTECRIIFSVVFKKKSRKIQKHNYSLGTTET